MILTRALAFDASQAAADAPIPATIASNAPVMRDGVAEILDCSADGADLSRAPLPLIVSHDSRTLAIGVVDNLQATGDRVTGQVKFGTSPEAQQIRADVVAGIHRSLSVGYRHLSATQTPAGTVYRWQPHECSIVSVPADPQAGFYRNFSESTPMTTPTITREAEITALCKRHGMPELATDLNRDGATMEAAGLAVLRELATRDEKTGGHHNHYSSFDQPQINAAASRELLIETLVERMGGKAKGETIRNTDISGLATRALELRGHSISHREGRETILARAMGTSDFPHLLGTAAGRVLLQAFEDQPAVLKLVARMHNLPDFRARSVVRLASGAPSLEPVNEGGEYTYGAIDDAANTWSLKTYGRIVSLTRQAMINDDLGAFASIVTEFGKAAARRESDILAALIVGTPQIDGSDLFSDGRSSLITTAALSVSSLAAAVLALRKQKEVGGGYLNQGPGTLLVPAYLEHTAKQIVTVITPAKTSDVQPFSSLQVVIEPRLDVANQTTWYLIAGNADSLEYGYLDSAVGPQVTQQEGFETDGLQIKCSLDFGAGFVRPTGWVKATA